MGKWLNVALVAAEPARVDAALTALLAATGRKRSHPTPRTTGPREPMQYGRGDEVPRWGVAVFAGAPGWSVVRTAPFELLLHGERPLLSQLTAALGAAGFQYGEYDGDSQLLIEADATGRLEKSGFVGSDPTQHWGAEGPPEDRVEARFRVVDLAAVCAWVERELPDLQVRGTMPSYRRPTTAAPNPRIAALWDELEHRTAAKRDGLLALLDRVGADLPAAGGFMVYGLHPAHVVRALATGDGGLFDPDLTSEAVCQVFGGEQAEHCDNGFLVETLIPHAPLPLPGFVSYWDL